MIMSHSGMQLNKLILQMHLNKKNIFFKAVVQALFIHLTIQAICFMILVKKLHWIIYLWQRLADN